MEGINTNIKKLWLIVLALLVVATALTSCKRKGTGPSGVAEDDKVFLAGAAQVDITPQELPVIVSGSFLERTAETVRDRLYARSLVFDDGTSRVAICIVDILFMPRDLLDEAKRLASNKTGIRTENMLVSCWITFPNTIAK